MEFAEERRFVQSFIRKERRERLLYELTNRGKRYDGLSRFCHNAGDLLDPKRIVMEGEDLERRAEFSHFAEEHKGQCLVLSPDIYLYGEHMDLKTAVEEALQNPDAVLILGQGFALVFGEVMKGGRGKYLLSER